MTSERQIEALLTTRAKERGGLAMKWAAGQSGAPDRIVVLPQGRFLFVECKAPNGRLSPLQERLHGILRGLGHQVYVVASREAVEALPL